MHYIDRNLGFSFDLPEGWRHDPHNLTLTFFGPNGRIGSASEVIQMQIGTVLPRYMDTASREQFMSEPGATVSRANLGDEANVVVLKKPGNSEISAVHDGIQYSIAHAHDAATQVAIERLKATFGFPSREKAISAIESWNDPHRQAILKALKTSSPEGARRILTDAGMPPTIERPGYTIHRVGSNEPTTAPRTEPTSKKWWQFWK